MSVVRLVSGVQRAAPEITAYNLEVEFRIEFRPHRHCELFGLVKHQRLVFVAELAVLEKVFLNKSLQRQIIEDLRFGGPPRI